MEQQLPAKEQPNNWGKYRFLFGGVLALCTICMVVAIALVSWNLVKRQTAISNATVTAAAHIAEQDQYEFVEHFDVPTNLWYSGSEDDEYWVGQVSIENGIYVWNADEVKETFVQWADFRQQNSGSISDFDVYVDVKFMGTPGGVCGGFIFREARSAWENGRYTFSVCSDSHFEVYYDDRDGWQAILDGKYSRSIRPDNWNRIEISARGDHFTFTINNEIVYEMTDDRQKRGALAILFEAQKTTPGTVWFDNFGFQSRNPMQATVTPVALSTYETEIPATLISAATQQAQYELVDRFDSNENQWRIGEWLGLEWDGSQEIKSGVLVWDIDRVYDFAKVEMEIVPINDFINDYDTYVDTKLSIVPSGTACSGLMFRRSPLGWDTGGYSFMLCNTGNLGIYYHNVRDGWQEINSQNHPAIRKDDWNRLEVKVDGSHFTFLVNNEVVFETDDQRQLSGGVALMGYVEQSGTQILFDNFGYQSR